MARSSCPTLNVGHGDRGRDPIRIYKSELGKDPELLNFCGLRNATQMARRSKKQSKQQTARTSTKQAISRQDKEVHPIPKETQAKCLTFCPLLCLAGGRSMGKIRLAPHSGFPRTMGGVSGGGSSRGGGLHWREGAELLRATGGSGLAGMDYSGCSASQRKKRRR